MSSNKAGSFLAQKLNSEQNYQRKKKSSSSTLALQHRKTTAAEKSSVIQLNLHITALGSTLRVSNGTMLERKPEQKENQGLLLTYLTSGREKQKCLEQEQCLSEEHQGETDRLHPKTVPDEEGLPVITALKPGVREAAHPPANSVAGSLFLCSCQQESLCRVSNHSTRRIQNLPVQSNPPDNIIKTLFFCHRLSMPTSHQGASAGTGGSLTQ